MYNLDEWKGIVKGPIKTAVKAEDIQFATPCLVGNFSGTLIKRVYRSSGDTSVQL
jgi:hypothetical protein